VHVDVAFFANYVQIDEATKMVVVMAKIMETTQ
jgi:hypothetical protein